METATNSSVTLPGAQGFLQNVSPLWSLVVLPALALVVFGSWGAASPNEPPALKGWRIPFSDLYMYLVDQSRFLARATEAFRSSSIVQFRLGLKRVYLVSGPRNIQTIFRARSGIEEETMIRMAMEYGWRMTKEDIDKFAQDRTGRGKVPSPGSKSVPAHKRYWAINHQIYEDFLTSKRSVDFLGTKFFDLFSRRLEQYPVGEWVTVELSKMFRRDMSESTFETLVGPRVLELNPGYNQLYWDFDARAFETLLGLPRWLNPEPLRLQDKFFAQTAKWLEAAWENFDWDGPDADADWEPNFGARVCRELSKWLKENFSWQSQPGFFSFFFLGQNSNALPITTWAMMELIKDPELFGAVRAEVLSAYTTDPATGARRIDYQTLLALPLLQSVYAETLRLHMSFNVIRGVSDDIDLNGFRLRKGAMILMPSQVAQRDDETWTSNGHPASEFWGARHIKYEELLDEATGKVVSKPKFAFDGRAGTFFPYGGGNAICPGRHFAKQEILITLGALIGRFDIEFLEWTTPNGEKSDRPARDDEKYAGNVAMPPDREMKVRWKRLW